MEESHESEAIAPPRTLPGMCGGSRRQRATLASIYAVLIALALIAVFYGVRLRRNLYTYTDPVRFTGDITNGWNWGRRAMQDGVIATYDRLEQEQADNPQPAYGLDYPPVRTWIVSRWAAWNAEKFPGVETWQRDYEFSRPMLLGNNVAELLSAGLVFLIVRRQILRTISATGPYHMRDRSKAAIVGFLGAMLLWFNPGVLFDAHAFPQWDTWILPFFFGAVLAAMCDAFFIAGLLIGSGMLIKGQLLIGAPVLILWPAFSLNWRGVINFIAGAAAAVATVTWPWLVRGPLDYTVVLTCGAAATAGVVYWKKWRWIHLVASVIGVAALVAARPLGGSLAWWDVGFVYGSRNFAGVMYTIGVSNLCAILQERYGFHSPLQAVDVPWFGLIVLKSLLTTITAATVMICGAGAAFHYRRRDPRFLVAIAAPFVLFYTLMPQMHDRYLVWGAAATALFITMGAGMTLLHWGVTAIMWLAITRNLCQRGPDWWPALTRFVDGCHVGIGWALLLLAAVLLYHAGPWPIGNRPVRPFQDE